MRRISLLLAALLLSAQAVAGPFTDDMSKCLVNNTSQQDKTDLVRWIFSLMARHPDVADLAAVAPEKRDDLNRKAGLLFQRLLTDTCKAQTQAALRSEGQVALFTSFQALGGAATVGLMSHPQVSAGSQELLKYLDFKKLDPTLQP
jgi:hypothetical protein